MLVKTNQASPSSLSSKRKAPSRADSDLITCSLIDRRQLSWSKRSIVLQYLTVPLICRHTYQLVMRSHNKQFQLIDYVQAG